MGHYADAIQLVELASELGGCEDEIAHFTAAMDILGKVIADKLSVNSLGASLDIGGLMVCFAPRTPDQVCPEKLVNIDPRSEWAEGVSEE